MKWFIFLCTFWSPRFWSGVKKKTHLSLKTRESSNTFGQNEQRFLQKARHRNEEAKGKPSNKHGVCVQSCPLCLCRFAEAQQQHCVFVLPSNAVELTKPSLFSKMLSCSFKEEQVMGSSVVPLLLKEFKFFVFFSRAQPRNLIAKCTRHQCQEKRWMLVYPCVNHSR